MMAFWRRRPSRCVHAAVRSAQGRPLAGNAVLSSLLEAANRRFQDESSKARKSESGTPSLPSVAQTGWEMTRITARRDAGENIYLARTRSP